ncbi:MAG TPA: EscU/YscU/HrcU family type III secretion system export apparatus switch protein [Thermaerobacter sp.]
MLRRPLRAAAALRYEPTEDAAPRVVAAGFGTMAEAILRRAREAGVPLVRSPLAPILARVPPGQEIPPALYEVVARIMALALEVDRQLAESRGLAQRWGLATGSTAPAAPPPGGRTHDRPRPSARQASPGPGDPA